MSSSANAPRGGSGARSSTGASVRDDDLRTHRDDPRDRGLDHDRRHDDHDDDPDGAGVTAIVLGVIGLVAVLVAMGGFMPLILGIIGLVLGVAGVAVAGAAWSRRRPSAPKPKGTLIGGIALSGVAALLGVVVVAMVAAELQSMDETVERLELEVEQMTDQAEDATD